MSDEINDDVPATESGWTQAQKDAFAQCEKIMREHFDSGVIACVAEIDDHKDENCHSYHGGRLTAIGLHQLSAHKIINKNPGA
jgi:hypothetical protein